MSHCSFIPYFIWTLHFSVIHPCSRIPSRTPQHISSSRLLRVLWAVTIPQMLLGFDDLTSFENCWSTHIQTVPHLGFFLCLDWGLEPRRGGAIHHIVSRVHAVNITYPCWCWPWPREVMFVGFFGGKATFVSSFHILLFGSEFLNAAHTQGMGS